MSRIDLDTPIDYRMDRDGSIFLRRLDGEERRASPEEARSILIKYPEVALSLSNKG